MELVEMAKTLRDWEMEQFFGKDGIVKEGFPDDVDCTIAGCPRKANDKLDLTLEYEGVDKQIIKVDLCEDCKKDITADCKMREERAGRKHGI